jgi:hypothetical protein
MRNIFIALFAIFLRMKLTICCAAFQTLSTQHAIRLLGGMPGANQAFIPNKKGAKPWKSDQQESEYEIRKSSAEGCNAVNDQHCVAERRLGSVRTRHYPTGKRRS